jgi:hypothetical protein
MQNRSKAKSFFTAKTTGFCVRFACFATAKIEKPIRDGYRTLVLIIAFTFVPLWGVSLLGAQELKLGELELIYTEDEIPIRYDGSLSTLRRDGEMHFFHSFGCRFEPGQHRRSRHSWHKGTPEDPLKTHVVSKTEEELWDYNGYYQDVEEEGIWILGMYECPNLRSAGDYPRGNQ